MGTDYTVYKDNKFELDISEMSNYLQFVIYNPKNDDEDPRFSERFSPEVLAEVAIKMIQAASYWVEDDIKFLADTANKIKEL